MSSSKNIIHSTEAPSSSLSVLGARHTPPDIVTSVPVIEKGGVVVAADNSVLQESKVDEGLGEESNSAKEKLLRRRRLIQFATLCWCFILEGWNDGSTGPLLPRIQNTYHVNYTVVSLIFILQCVGFIIGAMLNIHLTERLGFGKVIVLGTVIQVIVYAIEIPTPPFPVWVFAFGLYGVGTALQTAQVNAFVAGMNDPLKMAILHACYGSGALASPFVATQFSKMHHWSYHYFTALGLALQTLIQLILVFRFKTQNEVLIHIGLPPCAANTNPQNRYRQIWGLRVVHLLAFFILAYCGIEVTIGGWAVTYIIHRTSGGPSSGYVSSGFFGGLAFGRIFLIWVTKKIGERRVIFLYAIIAIGLEIFVWALPSLIPSAIAISFVGFFLGPMFPIIMNQCGYFLPSHLLSGAIGWITSFGLIGTALVPFMTGALANRFGVVSLQPLLIAMMVFMSLIWGYANYDHRKSQKRRSS